MKIVEQLSRKTYMISGTEIIGRGHGATITIKAPAISRSHCRLKVHGNDEVLVKDLGSSNGTLVNDTPIRDEEMLVTVGDVIGVGFLKFIITK